MTRLQQESRRRNQSLRRFAVRCAFRCLASEGLRSSPPLRACPVGRSPNQRKSTEAARQSQVPTKTSRRKPSVHSQEFAWPLAENDMAWKVPRQALAQRVVPPTPAAWLSWVVYPPAPAGPSSVAEFVPPPIRVLRWSRSS